MTKIEFLMMKYAHMMHRPVTFPEMANAIGKADYLETSRSETQMIAKGWITRIGDPTRHLQFVYAPTEKGWEIYEAHREIYKHAEFVEPIQGGF